LRIFLESRSNKDARFLFKVARSMDESGGGRLAFS
jgi:hypothetical protein